MAVAFFVTGYDAELLAKDFKALAPERDVRVYPNVGNADEIEYALGAGVDHILKDPALPPIPLVRVADPDMTMRMSEYVMQHVLMHHRQQRRLDDLQRQTKWTWYPQWPASALRVGVMGLGVLGLDAARKLSMMGFQVAGWSRTSKSISAIDCFSGRESLDAFLGRTHVLVCLLPLTSDTRNILNRSLIGKLAKDSPLGGPVLINVARGELHVEGDVVAALDAGELFGASFDVFETEPLAAESPLWKHPRVYVTPHLAGDSSSETVCRYVLRQIARYEAGQPMENVVDPKKGY